ncbi:S8 family serine peptidase [Nocardioides insulae]|uniref:S8 family serine peptidase n=1 Tax=Nocardioides insulae TaxID=394734 RepID=UPI0004095189|nr:S8 family serine peptidase [Nocardioides insulae]
MSRRPVPCRLAAGLCALALGAGAITVAGSAPAYAVEGDYACADLAPRDDPERYQTSAASAPLETLGIADAHAWLADHGRALGDVGVAVVDSGVASGGGNVPVSEQRIPAAPVYYHGTAVAGLIAGRPRGDELTGVAPDAHIVDARFYTEVNDEGESPDLTNANLAAALQWLLARPDSFDIVNLSVKLNYSDEVAGLIAQLVDRGKIVVAASGNRPDDQSDPYHVYYGVEDVAEEVFPAGYDGVLAASAEVKESGSGGADASSADLASSAIDVSAPTMGAVSYAVTGESCLLNENATSWAAGLVSGVLALLRSAYPDDTPQQLVTRLKVTASGRVDVPGTFRGAGMVQPMEALTRPLKIDADGSVQAARQAVDSEKAALPPVEDDVLADIKRSAVWWGVLGGGALLVAVLLRPLFARRR